MAFEKGPRKSPNSNLSLLATTLYSVGAAESFSNLLLEVAERGLMRWNSVLLLTTYAAFSQKASLDLASSSTRFSLRLRFMNS